MFGRASSRPMQKLEADPGIAIVPYEALSKGAPRNEEKSLTQLVGGNAQLVGRKAIAFSCSEPWEFPSRCGVTGVLWSPAKGGRFAQSWQGRGRCNPGFGPRCRIVTGTLPAKHDAGGSQW